MAPRGAVHPRAQQCQQEAAGQHAEDVMSRTSTETGSVTLAEQRDGDGLEILDLNRMMMPAKTAISAM
jgi:hypothetical protein